MAIPDPLPFFGANEAAFDGGCGKEVGKGSGLALLLWEVERGARFT